MTRHDDLTDLPVHILSQRLRARTLSPVTLVDAYLARIEREDPALRAYADVYADDARLAAQAADSAIRAGHAVGPLHGVPIALKDLIDIAGRPTGGGSLTRVRQATHSATLAERLLAQGMIVLGKTHTVEFAMGGWGTNSNTGTPWNPWDPRCPRTPGGSSSGSGVAVAAGLAPWAVGTDTGGSVRLPASWCGITGLKTTTGRVSTHGILPLSPTLDTPGPMARSVEDVALLYSVMQGADPRDPLTRGLAYADPFPGLRRGIKGLRLAHMPRAEREYASAEVLAAYDRSLEELAQLGAEIVPLELPFRFMDVATDNLRIMAAESYAMYHAIIDDETAAVDPHVRPRLAAGRGVTARQYIDALSMRAVMMDQFNASMEDIDALLTPTTMTTALPLEDVDQTQAPAHYTRFANYLNLAALALPNGADEGGLPTSLQIVTRSGDEAMALRIGWALQDATAWHLRRPGPMAPDGGNHATQQASAT
ncbi:Aspartyl-tRNA(Asn) amidotransferase subunit A @ Glutamyl-tRNA(Gln) amidotransferase subunit A [plant metagenome]|uniref:Aspartyl-tRNA(Asn) amidotransferase subunit A @ Glutamyl-tRNA(Gln) amidotransferase subunit A n=1 Tax=plant metagenome TaxID=1297885 RepID=A0A484TN76_9ZZZZ